MCPSKGDSRERERKSTHVPSLRPPRQVKTQAGEDSDVGTRALAQVGTRYEGPGGGY